MDFKPGDYVQYKTPYGNIIKGSLIGCWNADAAKSLVKYANQCEFTIEEVEINKNVYIDTYDLKVGSTFMVNQKNLRKAIRPSNVNKAIRNVYTAKTRQSGVPGRGPANLIRAFTLKKGGKAKTRKLKRK